MIRSCGRGVGVFVVWGGSAGDFPGDCHTLCSWHQPSRLVVRPMRWWASLSTRRWALFVLELVREYEQLNPQVGPPAGSAVFKPPRTPAYDAPPAVTCIGVGQRGWGPLGSRLYCLRVHCFCAEVGVCLHAGGVWCAGMCCVAVAGWLSGHVGGWVGQLSISICRLSLWLGIRLGHRWCVPAVVAAPWTRHCTLLVGLRSPAPFTLELSDPHKQDSVLCTNTTNNRSGNTLCHGSNGGRGWGTAGTGGWGTLSSGLYRLPSQIVHQGHACACTVVACGVLHVLCGCG